MGNSQGKPVEFDGEGLCFRSPTFHQVSVALLVERADLVVLAVVNLNHFRLLRVVGRGAFGKVRIVERKDTGLSFALKYIRKDEGSLALWIAVGKFRCRAGADLLGGAVVRSESVRNIIRERRMLEHVNHPFICNLRYSFQDIEYMYARHLGGFWGLPLTGTGTWLST